MNLYPLLLMVFKHARKVTVISVSVVAIVIALSLMEDPLYEANSTLLVETWKDNVPTPQLHSEDSSPATLTTDEVMNSEIQLLTSRELAERVISTVGVGILYPDLLTGNSQTDTFTRAAEAFKKSLKATGVKKSNIITISFDHVDPDIAAKCVNLLVDAYKEQHLSVFANPQAEFIKSRMPTIEQNLEQSQRDLQEFQLNNTAFSLEDKTTLLLRQRGEFDGALKIARQKISELQAKTQTLRAQQASLRRKEGIYANSAGDGLIVDAKAKLVDLQLREQEARTKYSDDNEIVVDAKRKLQVVSEFIKGEERGFSEAVKTANPLYQGVEIDLLRAEADLSAATAEVESLQNHLGQLDQQISVLHGKELRIQDLKRQVAFNDEIYRTYSDRLVEAHSVDAMKAAKLCNITVIQAAVAPVKPIKPEIVLNIALGLLLGFECGIMTAYFYETVGATFSDPRSVEKALGMSVLATVAHKSAYIE